MPFRVDQARKFLPGIRIRFSHRDQDSRRPPPPTRYTLLALTSLTFNGATDYLEDLISRIDASILEHLSITFVLQIRFDTPQLSPVYRSHTKVQVKVLSDAYIFFDLGHFAEVLS